ncbi:MAG: histidinol-phosphate transaminase [Clostridia bacterium]|nr:histidinol-phosphate transaminase [Clostridia bacterium]
MSRFLDERYKTLSPYVPGEQPQDMQYVKLNTNESPFPPSEKVIEALSAENVRRLNLYPDPEALGVRRAIAEAYGLRESQIVMNNGSDETLAFCFLAFCGAGTGVAYPAVSYGFYPVYARLCCIDAREVPLREDFSICPSDYFGLKRTIVIANPNAPTGIPLSRARIEEIVAANPENVVIVDEAYVDFGAESAVPLIDKYENLVVVQTFSKSRNLAGMRLGFAAANESLIADLKAIKYSFNPYNLNRLACLAGEAAFRDTEYFTKCTGEIMRTREVFTEKLKKLGFDVLPSGANFVFAAPEELSGEDYYGELKSRGVLVRYFDKPGLRGYVRITIGTDAQMRVLLEKTAEILEGRK